MANDTDHRLVSDLMDLVQKRADDPVGADRAPAAPPARRRILDIVIWSSLTNLVLLGVFMAGWNFNGVRAYVIEKLDPAEASLAGGDDPLRLARPELHDNELLMGGPQRQLKGPLQITLVPSSLPEGMVEPAAAAEPVAVALDETVGVEPDQGDGAGDMTVGPEDPAAQLIKSPVLRRAPSGGVEIGSFATVSMPGPSSECLDTVYGLLDDAGAPRDKLKVLAESPAITVARFCAANGSLVVTCRMDQITISPRRLKPNESCTG